MPSLRQMAVAKGAKFDLNAIISSDESVVIDTHYHDPRGMWFRLLQSVVVLAGFALFLVLVWWGRDNLPNWPIVSVAWSTLYKWIFVERWGAIGTVIGYFMVILVIARGSLDFRDTVYVATNKRIIWVSRKSGEAKLSVPRTDVKKVVLWGKRGHGGISFGIEGLKPLVVWWFGIPEPESVWKKLRAITPETDTEYIWRRHALGSILLWVATTLIFLSFVSLMAALVSSMATESDVEFEKLKFWAYVMIAGGLVAIVGYHLNMRFTAPKRRARRDR